MALYVFTIKGTTSADHRPPRLAGVCVAAAEMLSQHPVQFGQ